MKKKVFLLSMVTAGALAIGVAVFAGVDGMSSPSLSYNQTRLGGDYALTLDNAQTPEQITESYQNNVVGTVRTALGNGIKMHFVNAKQLASGFVQLANHGKIYNYDGGDAVTGFDTIHFEGEGSLVFKPVLPGGILADVDPVTVAPGDDYPVPACDYFEIEAGDSGASITSLQFKYSCDAEETNAQLLDGTYTGIGSDTSIYKLVVSNGSVSIQSLDKEHNLSLSGTYVMLDKDTAKCTFVYNTYNIYYVMDFNGHSFTFVSKSDDVGGAVAAQVAEVNLDRVYNVEDFESYTSDGKSIGEVGKYDTKGLRSHFYPDWYTGSSSGEIGGNGWPIMTSTDNTNWRSGKGHNGSAAGVFKFSTGQKMRYISMNELYGVKSVIGKGAKLSFWARGAYKNASCSTDSENNTPMKFYAYYGSPLTPSTQTTYRESAEFTVQAGTEWQHFEMPLTADRKYYGFGFYSEQKGGHNQYLPIDDIQIYTASPYAEYVAPAVPATGVEVTPSSASIEVAKTVTLTAEVLPANADNKNVLWSSGDESIAIVSSEGVVRGVSIGTTTITATTVDGGFTDTCEVEVTAAVGEPNGVYLGTAVALGNNVPITIVVGSNGPVSVNLMGSDAGATELSYNRTTKEITINTTGSYSSLSYGTVTGVYDEANDQIINIACNGAIADYISNNGEIVATKNVPLAHLDCDGTTSELQAMFKRRIGSTATTDADRIVSDTTNYASGTGALKLKGNSSGDVRLNLQNDLTTPMSVNKVGFWVYNPSSTTVKLRFFVYRATNFGSNKEFTPEAGVAIKSNGWTYFSYELDTAYTAYNFQIADFNKTGVNLTFDEISFYNTLS